MKFFRLDTKLTKSDCEKLLDSLSAIEIEELSSLDIISEDIEYNGYVSSYIICNDYTIAKCENFLSQKGIDFIKNEISQEILTGKISLKNTPFEIQTEKYIEQFLTIDVVLDKINQFGIDSLTELDKNCLKKI